MSAKSRKVGFLTSPLDKPASGPATTSAPTEELGQQIADLIRANPAITVFGGCCGTDMRHLKSMAAKLD
ncbi:homocysteine S-methyltransferase family protein [uncultured Litoreibacter sp.]|uniref:homocysteine S-methyltransferase family protein n=1 Tax=uncultured Litoreibacter sp. TaxID=1392394 RepID=UPI00262A6339|nr:homocysteine S-methyltransferase family protein [uncultured Litoreibacter sp.]